MAIAPNSIMNNRTRTQPIGVPRTIRRHSARGITSLPAGRMVPLAAVPLLREDAIRSGRMRFTFESMETAEILMNAINVRVMAYLVPNLAFERFNGSMDQLNLSYQGQPPLEGEAVVPYIETEAAGAHGANDVYTYLGLHARPTQLVNTAYLEAYNAIWNFRAKNRSPDLPQRDRLQATLAAAFWQHEQFRHIVPDFDQAKIDGEVLLNITGGGKMPVKGLGLFGATGFETGQAARESDGTNPTYAESYRIDAANAGVTAGEAYMRVKRNSDFAGVHHPDVWAELSASGITVSLANIDLARKTQAFARLREQYNGHSDEWIINLLMDGIHIPEQAFKQPMLLADRRTIFGMSKRYATDAGNLTESVVNGATFLDLSLNLPRINTGGVVMVVAEITPDQLFERQMEPYFHLQDVAELPSYMRDELDPEKVDVVKNERIDVDHATPNATFGYEPLNARWNLTAPKVGGKFYRPTVDGTADEDRQRIWAVEQANPTLSQHFYICPNPLPTKPFVVTNKDPFEVTTMGECLIEGNTVFGSHLIEATDDYEKVMAVAPQARIAKPE